MNLIQKISALDADMLDRIMKRSELDISEVEASVRAIISDVKENGDSAVKKYCKKFDHASLDNLKVSNAEFQEAENNLSDDLKKAIEHAITNVKKFHEMQVPKSIELLEIEAGVFAGEKATPIDSVGLYVPRGRGNFPSMLYMLTVPAAIAGVPELAITTPADKDGKIDAACLYAAKRTGVDTVYKASGAQAIAAFTYGTETIKKVDKILGPGSMYVAAAKRVVSSLVDCGLPAGPTESLIFADESANIDDLVKDLLVEAEHGSDSCALIVTCSQGLAENLAPLLVEAAEKLEEPRRSFVLDGFRHFGAVLVAESEQEALDFINEFASEHLQINTKSPFDILPKIRNAGEIILGPTPFSEANYVIGANAILPTGGKARTWASVSVRDFIKYSSVVYCTESGIDALAKTTSVLAEHENFPSHRDAVKNRNKS
jgi:histidinol dehydrogenase